MCGLSGVWKYIIPFPVLLGWRPSLINAQDPFVSAGGCHSFRVDVNLLTMGGAGGVGVPFA